MIRTILASAATLALLAGAAHAQAIYTEPAAEPLAADPAAPADPALPAEETVVVDPALAEPAPEAVPGEPVLAEPAPMEPAGIAQPPVAVGPPVGLAYPHLQSSAGLTPGAPLGTDAVSDQKAVAGDDLRGPAPGILFR